MSQNIFMIALLLVSAFWLTSCKQDSINTCEETAIVDGRPGSGLEVIDKNPSRQIFSSFALLRFHPENTKEAIAIVSLIDSSEQAVEKEGFVTLNLASGSYDWLFVREGEFAPWASGFYWGSQDWIVYQSRGQLYLCKPNGDSLTHLTRQHPGEYFDPCWSPAGDKVLCWGLETGLSGRKRLLVFDLEGNLLQTDSAAARAYYYYRHGDWHEDDLIVSTSSVYRQSLTFLSYPDLQPVKQISLQEPFDLPDYAGFSRIYWRPGTRKVLSQVQGKLYETDFDTEESRVVYDNCHQLLIDFAPTPDGQYAAFRVTDYEAAKSHIHLIDLDTGEETRFYTFPAP